MYKNWALSVVFLLFGASGFASGEGYNAGEYHVKFRELPHSSAPLISGSQYSSDREEGWVEWDSMMDLPLKLEDSNDLSLKPFVILTGKIKQSDSNLLLDGKSVPMGSGRKFNVPVPVRGETEKVTFVTVLKDGTLVKNQVELLFPEWQNFLTEQSKSRQLRPYSVQAGLGLGFNTYSQTDSALGTTNSFNQFGISFQGGARYQVKDWLILAGDAFITALPISLSSSGNTIRFLRTNTEVIYPIRFSQSGWTLEVTGDYSYQTSFASQSNFGYSNAQGLTIFPKVQRNLSHGKKMWALIRYLPILNGNSIVLSSSSSEVSFQAGFQGIELKNHHWVTFTADLAFLQLQYSGIKTGNIQSASYGVGANYLY